MPRLTEAFVEKLQPNGKSFQVRDSNVKGFFVQVNKDSKSYKVQRDLWVGELGRKRLVKTCRITIGRVGEVSLSEARGRALELLGLISRGIDPGAPLPVATWTVAEACDAYVERLRAKGASPRHTIGRFHYRFRKYLGDWAQRPIESVTKQECAARHAYLTRKHGIYPANQALRCFRAMWNYAKTKMDALDGRENPTIAVDWHTEAPSSKLIRAEELPAWSEAVEALGSPIRRAMQKLGLLSGLRPSNLVAIRKEWIDLDRRVVRFPAEVMKGRRPFDLPLSGPMVALVEEALHVGGILFPRSEHLFPSNSASGHVERWVEKTVTCGHVLRHSYRTQAELVGGLSSDTRLRLVSHKVPGMSAIYVHESELFGQLLEAQEAISARLLSLAGRQSSGAPG